MIIVIVKTMTAVGIIFPREYIYSALSSPSSIPFVNLVIRKTSSIIYMPTTRTKYSGRTFSRANASVILAKVFEYPPANVSVGSLLAVE